MKFYISPTEQYITLEGPAEHILARQLVRVERGAHHYLTRRLSKLVCQAINTESENLVTSFSGEEQEAIVEALHNTAIRCEDNWPSAQAAFMLAQAI